MNNPSCLADGCNKQIYVKKRGLCSTHYQYWCSYKDVPGISPRAVEFEPCIFDECAQPRRYGQLCMGHYNQRRKTGALKPLRKLTDPTIRDEAGNKQCRRCERWLATSEFSTNKARRDDLTAYCRRCERDKALIHHYGITLEQHEAMLAGQGGGCAICGGPAKDGRPFYVDHDHSCCPGQRTCGKCVRGLLCGDCNLGIGYFDDDVARMRRAIVYLRDRGDAPDVEAA
jgi:hypothetical protein